MAVKYPRDRFDSIPSGIERVGAHRAPGGPSKRWRGFFWAVLATVVLAGAGIIGIMAFNNQLLFSADETVTLPEETEVPVTAPPTLDPATPLTIMNGTPVSGLAASAGDTLTEEGWTVATMINADSDDLEMTTVYYAEASLEGAARGLAESVGGAEIALSSDVTVDGATLILVLGADYAERVASQ